MAGKSIKNGDIALLSKVLYLMQEIRMLEDKRDWIHGRMCRVTRGLSGMPRGGGGPQGMEETFARLSELDEKHAKQLKRCTKDLEKAEAIVNAIPDADMRTFVSMAYMRRMTKEEVMGELNMTEWDYRKLKEKIESAESMEKVRWDMA